MLAALKGARGEERDPACPAAFTEAFELAAEACGADPASPLLAVHAVFAGYIALDSGAAEGYRQAAALHGEQGEATLWALVAASSLHNAVMAHVAAAFRLTRRGADGGEAAGGGERKRGGRKKRAEVGERENEREKERAREKGSGEGSGGKDGPAPSLATGGGRGGEREKEKGVGDGPAPSASRPGGGKGGEVEVPSGGTGGPPSGEGEATPDSLLAEPSAGSAGGGDEARGAAFAVAVRGRAATAGDGSAARGPRAGLPAAPADDSPPAGLQASDPLHEARSIPYMIVCLVCHTHSICIYDRSTRPRIILARCYERGCIGESRILLARVYKVHWRSVINAIRLKKPT